MKHRSVTALSILVGAVLLLAGCAQATAESGPEASLAPTTPTTKSPKKLSDQDAWKLGEQDGEHRVGRIDSDTPEVRTLAVGPMQGKRYLVSFVCDSGLDLVVGVRGTQKVGEVDDDEYNASFTDSCTGEATGGQVEYDSASEQLESLYVEVDGEGEWAATFGWLD